MTLSPAARSALPGLGHVDDGVGDVGDLGLGRAVGERDLRLDAVAAEALRVSSGYSVLTRSGPGGRPGGRQVGQRARRRVGAHGQHDPGRVRRRLRVGELAERDHLAPPLLDAVASGDAEVEEPVGHVDGDLLGPQDADLARCGGRRWWPGTRRPKHG